MVRLYITQKWWQHAHDFLSGYQSGLIAPEKESFQVGKVCVFLYHVVVNINLLQGTKRVIILRLNLDCIHVKFTIPQRLSELMFEWDFVIGFFFVVFRDLERLSGALTDIGIVVQGGIETVSHWQLLR